ncbi:uncharacterized protein LOC135844857 isoform X2 [Planococcus citri]
MNIKLFYHLITAHLLSGWWSVPGQCANLKMLDLEDLEVLAMVTDRPAAYRAMRDRLIGLRHQLGGRLDEKRESHDVAKVEDAKNLVQMAAYVPIVQRVKLREWIFAIERNFPNWLRYLEVNRLIAWVLALKFAQEPIFDDLRRLLKARRLTMDTFANEMYSIYEDTPSSIPHKLPDVPDPKPDNIPRVCQLVAGNNEDKEAACVVLLHALFGTTEVPSTSVEPTSTTPDLYPTKFYVMIKHYKETTEEGREFASNKFSKIRVVESNLEFKKQNCIILDNFTIDHSKIDNTEFGKRQKVKLPTICVVMRIGFPRNLRGQSVRELQKKIFTDAMSVKQGIMTDLKNEDPSAEIFT